MGWAVKIAELVLQLVRIIVAIFKTKKPTKKDPK